MTKGSLTGLPFSFGYQNSAASVRSVAGDPQEAGSYEPLHGSLGFVGRDAIQALCLPEGQTQARELAEFREYTCGEGFIGGSGSKHERFAVEQARRQRGSREWRLGKRVRVSQLRGGAIKSVSGSNGPVIQR